MGDRFDEIRARLESAMETGQADEFDAHVPEDVAWLIEKVENLDRLNRIHEQGDRNWETVISECLSIVQNARLWSRSWKACAKRWHRLNSINRAAKNWYRSESERHKARIRELESELETFRTAERARLAGVK